MHTLQNEFNQKSKNSISHSRWPPHVCEKEKTEERESVLHFGHMKNLRWCRRTPIRPTKTYGNGAAVVVMIVGEGGSVDMVCTISTVSMLHSFTFTPMSRQTPNVFNCIETCYTHTDKYDTSLHHCYAHSKSNGKLIAGHGNRCFVFSIISFQAQWARHGLSFSFGTNSMSVILNIAAAAAAAAATTRSLYDYCVARLHYTARSIVSHHPKTNEKCTQTRRARRVRRSATKVFVESVMRLSGPIFIPTKTSHHHTHT